MTALNILLLPKYGQLAASTRYRYLQFLPHLERAGIHCDVSPLLDDEYLRNMFAGRRPSLGSYVAAFARRAVAILRAGAYDRVVIHCEAYPYLPPVLERLLGRRGVPYIYDFDDAIFHQYDQHPRPLVRRLLCRKIGDVIRGASAVIAGNQYLETYARQANDRVTVIPTVVDATRYRPRPERVVLSAARPLVIGWIGSPSSADCVAALAEPLRVFCTRHSARVVLIGSGHVDMPGVPVETRPWHEETEVENIQEFDVGIMPLPDTPWSRGKCGFKLIQYMACGIPVVASPVGANAQIVQHGVSGLHARTHADWIESLAAMASDPDLRMRLGAAGRRRVVDHYSLAVTAPRLTAVLAGTAAAS